MMDNISSSLQLNWETIVAAQVAAPTAVWLGGSRGRSVAWCGRLRCLLQGQAHPHFPCFNSFSSSRWRACGAFRCGWVLMFSHPTAPYSKSHRSGGASWRCGFEARLRLAALGCLLGVPWRPVCCSVGIPATYIKLMDRIEGVWALYTSGYENLF